MTTAERTVTRKVWLKYNGVAGGSGQSATRGYGTLLPAIGLVGRTSRSDANARTRTPLALARVPIQFRHSTVAAPTTTAAVSVSVVCESITTSLPGTGRARSGARLRGRVG